MRAIGRKLYLQWGPRMVLAIEKLPGANPDRLGLHDTLSDTDPGLPMRSLLVEVIDFDGERIERPVEGTRFPLNGARRFQDYLTDISCWITQEENANDERLLNENRGKVARMGGYSGDYLFYVDPGCDRRQEVEEWCRETDGADFYRNTAYLDTEDLAIQFQLMFGG